MHAYQSTLASQEMCNKMRRTYFLFVPFGVCLIEHPLSVCWRTPKGIKVVIGAFKGQNDWHLFLYINVDQNITDFMFNVPLPVEML